MGAMLSVWAIVVLPSIAPTLNALGVSVDNPPLLEKFLRVLNYARAIITGTAGENVLYGTPVTLLSDITLVVFAVIVIPALIFVICEKKWEHPLFMLSVAMVLFCLERLILSKRMQPQHFVPFYFFLVLTVGVALIKIFKPSTAGIYKKLVALLCAVLISFNVVNQSRVLDEIKNGELHSVYTKQINVLAEQALDTYNNGEKQLYVFVDWGFVFGFNYLTQNKIPITTELNVSMLDSYLSDGYCVVACYWSSEDVTKYEEVMKLSEADMVESSVVYNQSGTVAFYKTTVTRASA